MVNGYFRDKWCQAGTDCGCTLPPTFGRNWNNQGRKRSCYLRPNFQTEFNCQLGGTQTEKKMSYSEAVVQFFYPVATKIPKPLHSKLGGFTEDVYTRATYKDQFKKAIIQRPTVRGIIVASQVKIAFSYAKEDSGMGPNHTIPNMTATNALEDSGDISKDFFPRDSMETLELSDYSRI